MCKRIILCICAIYCVITAGFCQDNNDLLNKYLDSAKAYESRNESQRAYNTTLKAYTLLLKITGATQEKIGSLQSDMGSFAYRMGNIGLASMHHRNAIGIFQSMKNPAYRHLYLSGNNMGSIMWLASKIDSALFYFNIALAAIEKMEPTPENKYYRTAVLLNNLAAIYGAQGRTTEGIAAMKTTINNLHLFLETKETHPKKDNALHFQFEAADNLAGIYKELGDYRQAHSLLLHSFQQKQLLLTAGDADIFKSEILLGQLYFAMKEFPKAEQFLKAGLTHFEGADGDFLFWQADGYNTLALLADERREEKKAALFYEKSDSLYEESLQGEYDDIYLEFLRNTSLFYAQQHDSARALKKASKGYQYVLKTQGNQTLLAFYQLLNLSEVQFELRHYKEAAQYSGQGLQVVNKLIKSGNNWLDSIKMELKKPRAILLTVKSEYELLEYKSTATLLPLLNRLNEALQLIEKRKALLHDDKDLSLLIADQSELVNFIKKLTLEVYVATKQSGYIDQLISLHESAIYNRIRSRLIKADTLKFSNVPAAVQAKEKRLKEALTAITKAGLSHDQQMRLYLDAEKNWRDFLQELKTGYPPYYNLKYESIFTPLKVSELSIPANTTVIRYLFAGQQLVALVIDQKQRQLFLLDDKGIDDEINTLSAYAMDPEKTGEALHRLYARLWKPLAPGVQHSKVIIIPDGLLYNLNFELLTPKRVSRFEDLAAESLLAKYAMSYQYSLFLLDQKQADFPTDNFVGFAPGFLDPLKENYRKATGKSTEMDEAYLSLLPQPFTLDIAEKNRKRLGGILFSEEGSTVAAFKQFAGNHKIIHIGTHAEANNLAPQFSRLIFAKDPDNKRLGNSLYLFDLYNCELHSDLTVLTACESGKAGYEDGEGMISLSHAFNYAGSKSMLTGLWEIDEQASATLIDAFYSNLLKGLPKDEALRLAKLSYLRTAKGRTLAPQYWAGLILMGDTSPIKFNLPFAGRFFWITATMIFLLLIGYFFYRYFHKPHII